MRTALFFVTVGLGLVLTTTPALAQKGAQQTVTVDQLPAAVTAAVEKAYPKSTIVRAAMVSRGAQVRYELSVKLTPDAQPIAVLASPEGIIRTSANSAPPSTPVPAAGKAAGKGQGQRKAAAGSPMQGEPVALSQLPKAVVKAIKEAYPQDTIIAATKIASGSDVAYQLSIDDLSSVIPLRVFVGSDGKIQKR